MLVWPTDPIPSTVSFGPTQGCTDIVLLDESLSVIPRSGEGATGIVGFITSQSATHYLDNEEASQHMFRPWAGDDILLYTDDIGCMQVDGTIAIRGRSSRNVKINGLFVDLDYVERALAPAFADKSLNVTGFKLVKSTTAERIVLFASTQTTTDAMFVLKHARDHLRVSHNNDLALVINSVRCIPEMPFNSSYKIDLAELQKMVDSTETLPHGHFADAPVTAPLSGVDALAEKIAVKVTKLSQSPDAIPPDLPLLYSGLTSITMVRLYFWLQSEYEYPEQMDHLFDEEVTTRTIALEIFGDEEEVTEELVMGPTIPSRPNSQATVVDNEDIDDLASEEVTDFPLKVPVTAAGEIVVSEKTPDYLFEKEHEHNPTHTSKCHPASMLIVMQPPVETAIPDTINNIVTHPTLHITPYAFLFVSWMTPLLRLGSKRPLLESVVIFTSG